MQLSFWERETFFNGIDVAVIGSGIVGLNAALYLKKKQPKLKVIILERGMLPMGASSRNAGFACFGSASELLDDLKGHTEEEVFSLVEKRWKGLQRLRKNLGDRAIDFHNWGGYEVFEDTEKFEACADRLNYLNKQIAPLLSWKEEVYRQADKDVKRFGLGLIKHMILNTAEGQIDTGKMISALMAAVQKNGVYIVNGFEVKEMREEGSGVSILSGEGIHFRCRRAIVATNGFARQLLPDCPVYPARAQVLVTEPIPGLKLKGTFHFDEGYYYFRNIGNRVLFGGARNLDFKTEETTEFGLTDTVQDRLDVLLKNMILPYTKAQVDMRWSGIMGMGPQKNTIVQAVSPNVFCGVRMGGMGVAIGSLIGEEVAQLAAESL
jgi:glycine/D-amino acid oxidase-like deaminating enzyme